MHAMLVPNRDDRLESEHTNFHLDGRAEGSQMAEVAFSFHLVSIPSKWNLSERFLETHMKHNQDKHHTFAVVACRQPPVNL